MVSLFDKKENGDVDPLEVAADGKTGNPEHLMDSADINGHIASALRCLSEHEKTVFVLRHYHDMPLKEISSSLDIAEGTVKSLLFRSIRKLRERLSFYKEDIGLEDQR
jgi:RNA polymerase sigma-70 factor (ECF subfamily)